MDAEWMDRTLGLLMLVLTTLGAKVVNHLLLPHPASSSQGRTRRALALLLMAGQASFLLTALALFTGLASSTMDFTLSRIMELLCPLMLIRASLAHCEELDYDGRKGQKHQRRLHIGLKMPSNLSGKNGEEGTGEGKFSARISKSLASFLWGYLWMVAVGMSVSALFNPVLYPCVDFPRRVSSSSLTKSQDVIHMGEQYGNQLSVATEPQKYASLDSDVSFNFVQHEFPSSLPTVEKNKPSTFMSDPSEEYGWMCASVYSEGLLYCAFCLPLLLYLACYAWYKYSTKQETVLDPFSPPSSMSHSSLYDSQCKQTDIHTAMNQAHSSCCQDVQSLHFLPATHVSAESSFQNDVNLLSSNTCSSEHDACLTLFCNAGTSQQHPKDSEPQEYVPDLSTSNTHTQTLSKEEKLMLNTSENKPTSLYRNMKCQDDCQSRLAEDCAVTGEAENQGRECTVCVQVAPYVVLATVVVIVQRVLVMPVWAALFGWSAGHQTALFGWSASHQMPVLPSCALYLPVYCAVVFTGLAALHAPP